jgi:endoglucanase
VDILALLKDWTGSFGPSGNEGEAARAIADAFAAYCRIETDALQNVIATMGEGNPRVMITAHTDEIAMISTVVEDDGAIRFARVNGIDPRTLPGARVWVHAEADGVREPLLGVVGALPPHLLQADKQGKNYPMDEMYIDVGLSAEAARDKVAPGTLITLDGEPLQLKNNRIACKTLDDRAGIVVMLRAAEILSERKFKGQVSFVAASQEEMSGGGAETAAYKVNPDCALAIDMTLGKGHAQDSDDTFPLDTVVAAIGPYIHRKLNQYLLDTAQEEHVSIQKEYASRSTSTNADDIQISREGIPVALLSVPTLYMHTPVEVAALDTLEEAARLVAAFVAGLSRKEEGWLCDWND